LKKIEDSTKQPRIVGEIRSTHNSRAMLTNQTIQKYIGQFGPRIIIDKGGPGIVGHEIIIT
jgi:hypothetical protein